MPKKIINNDTQSIIGHFEESELDATIRTYESYFASVSVDIDGDIIVSETEDE